MTKKLHEIELVATTEKERYFDTLTKSSHEFMATWKRVEGNNATEEVTPEDRTSYTHEMETSDLLTIAFTAVFMTMFFTLLYATIGG
jgi:hypothetical protein